MSFHPSHTTKSLVSGVCKKCKSTFLRDGDLMSISMAYSTPSHNSNVSLQNVKTYTEWLVFASDFCGSCLPPMPEAVKKDINNEKNRKSQDIVNYHMTKDNLAIPFHESKNTTTNTNKTNIGEKHIKQPKISKIRKFFLEKDK